MAATVTLSTTSLNAGCGAGDSVIRLASRTGVSAGTRLYVDRELMTAISLGVSDQVNVRRGTGGTAASAHSPSATVTIGEAHQFFTYDPTGRPIESVPVEPWINVENGKVWVTQGDELPVGTANRWWQERTTEYSTGALGVRTTTTTP